MWMVSSAFPVSCGRDELGRNHNPRQSLSNGANQKPSSAFIFIKLLSTLFWYVLKLELRMVDLFLGLSQVALVVKNPPANAGDIRDLGSISGSGRSPGGEHGNPLQYSCLENPRGQRSLEGYSPWGHKESGTAEATYHAPDSYCLYVSSERGHSVASRLEGYKKVGTVLEFKPGRVWDLKEES